MKIIINGCEIDKSLAEMLTGDNAPKVIYMIDEHDEIYLSLEQAMEAGRKLAEDWDGDVIIGEYDNNLLYDDGFTLRDESRAPIDFNGNYWTI